MLDGSKIEDLKEIAKYGKSKGYLLAKRYGLPTYSNFYILESEEDVQILLSSFKNQNNFCMRSDTKIGNNRIDVNGKNGNRRTIAQYMREIIEKSNKSGTKGVAMIYWNEGRFCTTYEIDGCFYLYYRTNKDLIIDYVGRGWDGSFLSHGTACHETYVIPWEEVLFFKDTNRNKYRKQIISEYAYKELRKARIEDLNTNENYSMSLEECERIVPNTYTGIKSEYLRQVINQVIIPMYTKEDLQKYYKEYVPIVQIENGKVLVPEIILPERLKYKENDMDEFTR